LITYRRLWDFIKKKELTANQLRLKTKLGGGTMQKLQKNEFVSTSTLDSLCKTLKCNVSDIIEYIEEEDA
jgi:DNA-binding Xre family transcriptional regulator